MNETLVEDVRLGRDKSNLTECLTSQFGLTPALVASAAPPKVRLRPYLPRESTCLQSTDTDTTYYYYYYKYCNY